MHIVFHSNYVNHHQRGFLEQLVRLGCQITFIAHGKISQERINLGYSTQLDMARQVQYDETTADEVYKITMEADAVIFGTKPKKLFNERVRSGKLTFNYSERLFKRGAWQKFSPLHQIKLRRTYMFDRKNAPYVLCAGGYVAQDFKSLGYPKDRFLKWGYFPPLTETALPELLQKKQDNTIIWVARFIPCKHPEVVVELAKYLKQRGLSFKIKMVGIGELLDSTQSMIEAYHLGDYVEIVGALPPEKVREEFEKAQISLLTSDRIEGWGAVVNEAMNSACAMISSSAAGSSTYLIQNSINGYTYANKKEQLFHIVEQLLNDKAQCVRLGSEAYRTITGIWNYKIAAKRFVDFVKTQKINYLEGPMSEG